MRFLAVSTCSMSVAKGNSLCCSLHARDALSCAASLCLRPSQKSASYCEFIQCWWPVRQHWQALWLARLGCMQCRTCVCLSAIRRHLKILDFCMSESVRVSPSRFLASTAFSMNVVIWAFHILGNTPNAAGCRPGKRAFGQPAFSLRPAD